MQSLNPLVRKTAIGVSWLVAWRMLTRILGMLSTLVLARILVPADFGLLAMATTFSMAIEAMSQFGLQDALVRRPQEGRDLYDAAFTLQAIRALVTAALLAAGAPVAAWWFAEPRLMPVLLVLAATSVLTGFENIGIVEFRRELRFSVQFLLLAAPRLLQVAVAVPLALVWRSYWALLAGIVVARLARLVMTYLVHPYRPRLGLTGWRELFGFSFWIWASALAALIWDRCDPFVLGPAIGTARLGIYLTALDVAILPITELIAPAADALLAGLASAQRQGSSSVRAALPVASALLLVVAPIAITVSCAAADVVSVLLGPKWAAAGPLIAVLAGQCLFAPFSWLCTVTLVANGLVRHNFVANLLASLVRLAALAATVALTDRMEVIAAVTVAIVAAEVTIFVAVLCHAGEAGLRDVAGGLLRAMLAGAASIAVLMQAGLAWQMATTSYPEALGHGATIVVVTFVVFSAADVALWTASGRPAGPEARLLQLVGHLMRPKPRGREAGQPLEAGGTEGVGLSDTPAA